MTTIELFTRLRKRDIHLWLEDDRLRYRAPEGALTPDLRQEIAKNKANIIDFLRQASGAVGAQDTPIERATRDGDLPLSYAQQRLWFLDQFDPGSTAYNMFQALRFEGPVDFRALQHALTEIVRRHEVLRTTMPAVRGKPHQLIHPPAPQFIPEIDLGALPASRREGEAQRLTSAEAATPFDLAAGPVRRTTLLLLAEDDHVLLITLHHIAADGWSMGIVVRELQAHYGAFRVAGGRNVTSPFPELPIQYADFSAWQRQWLSKGELDRQINYWKKHLEGAPQLLDLPTDYPYPAVRSLRGAKVDLGLLRHILDPLLDLARRQNGSLFMVVLSLYQVLLSRYSGQRDVVMGTPIANRNRAEIEPLIGFFVNTLVLRLRSTTSMTFRQLVAQAREVTLEAYAHQDVPFEKLVDEVETDRGLTHHPLFQAMFALQNASAKEPELPGVKMRPLAGGQSKAKFHWNLSLTERPLGLGGWLEYSTELFDRSTIFRVARHFTALAASAAADPDALAFELSMLDPSERQQLRDEWNPVADANFETPLIHSLFAAQAERTPERLAAVLGSLAMTYGELDRRANQLAHRLRRLGVGPDVAVAISIERSLHMAVAVVGVLKAGGVYVALDPAYPQDRLDFMLHDSGARVIVTQPAIAERFAERAAASHIRVLLLSDGWSMLEGSPRHDPEVNMSCHHLHYMIYTSGSTGRPKGIAVPHRPLTNLIQWHVRHLRVENRALQFASLSFDASFHEMFAAWASGGTLFLIPEDLRRDVDALARLLSVERIEKVTFPVVLLQRMAELYPCRRELPLALEEITATGEQLNITTAMAEFVTGLGDCLFLNQYGPSETHVALSHTIRGPATSWPPLPPLGRAIDQAPVYVFDRSGKLVPLGVPGEIVLGGVAPARGYLERPSLTAEKFVPDPLASEGGARLYRSGDLARVLTNGNIDFLGRIDHQVKIRGHRVELGEIESVLSRHGMVSQCLVLARQDRTGSHSLVAYYVAEAGARPRAGELRDHVGELLPEFMLPSYFVALDAFPLSPNKKVDRKALPTPEEALAEADEIVEPRTPVEEGLVEIWRQVLSLEAARAISIEENFFHLGGHSLYATQVVSQIRLRFDVELPVRRLFEAPTLVALAAEVEAAIRGGGGVAAPPLTPVPRAGDHRLPVSPVPLSHAQQRLWFLDQLEPGSSAYNIPQALRFQGSIDFPALKRSLSEIVRRQEVLRTTMPSVDGKPHQRIHPPTAQFLPRMDLTSLPLEIRETEAQRLAQAEAARPFDLAGGPIFRTSIAVLADDDHVLLVTIHHIATDGWSMGILVRELSAHYKAFSAPDGADAPPPLPELPIQYADFAVWQRQWLSEGELERQINFWKEHLEGAPPALDLPGDRPYPATRSFRGASVAMRMPKDVSHALSDLARQEQGSLFMVALTIYQVLLCRYSGQMDVVIGSPIANRNREEIEPLIGFFVNTLVLRLRATPKMTLRELVAQAREVTLESYAHQDVPFEKLVEEVDPQRDLSRHPLFQVVFILQNAPSEALELPGVKLRRMGSDLRTAKFDWIVTLSETPWGLAGGFEYATDLFDRTTALRMVRHYAALAAAAVRDPDQSLFDLTLLGLHEHQQLLHEWNPAVNAVDAVNAVAGGDVGSSMHGLFEARAASNPEAIAVVADGEEELTYGQLNHRANQLARHLRSLGVGPGVFVAVFLDRTSDLVTATVAILKAGGAYAPLEINLPAARVRFILADLKIRHVLTQSPLAERLTELTDLTSDAPDLGHVIFLDPAADEPEQRRQLEARSAPRRLWTWSDLATFDASNLSPAAGPGDIAYIIFTSGSTGTPKGVVVRHAPVLNLVHWIQHTFGVGPGDRVLFMTSLSFDLSVYDIFGLLGCGGSIRVASRDDVQDPQRLVRILLEEPITFWDSAPAALQQLVSFLPEEAVAEAHLRLVFLSGDWIPVTLPERITATFPGARMIGLGGATEATVWSNYHSIDQVPAWWVSIPYGRPIWKARYHVLDELLRPIPAGIPGDLFIGGECLAMGYSDLVLTAHKFIPDPWTGDAGGRLYRTGDRARYWADGKLEFLGRLDHQVKIRGFRIELGEISTVLGEHPAIQDAAAIALEDPSQPRSARHKRLVAYVVARTGQPAPTTDELRTHLLRRLPEYMVPTAFVVLEELPVTASGKLDRKALPDPEPVHTHAAPATFAEPRNEVEAALVEIWRSVLRLERVGIHDSFFELGGDSIISIQIVARANKQGLRLTPRQIFQHQTVAELALVVGSEGAVEVHQGLVLGPVEITPAQRWFFEQESSAPHHFNLSVLLQLLDPPAPGVLERTLETLLSHHDALRLRFRVTDEGWRQTSVSPLEAMATSAVARIDLTAVVSPGANRHEVIESAAARLQASLDLEHGPLFRIVWFDLGAEQTDRLLIVAHHLVIDGVSWRILLGDLETVADQLSRGDAPALPAKTTSFKKWSDVLADHARSGLAEDEGDYWLDDRRRRALPLPLDHPEGANTLPSARHLSVSLGADDTRALLQEVPKAYRTQINDVLTAALVDTFANWTGSPYLLLEVEGHGREEELFPGTDLSLTVGWFTVLYPLLVERPGGGPGELIKWVKEQIRGVPNRGIGYGLLRYLAGDEGLKQQLESLPRPEVTFNYLGQLDQALPETRRFSGAPESTGPASGGTHLRRYTFEINLSVSNQRLGLSWTYSENLHQRKTIERLAEAFLSSLRGLIEHCRSPEAGGFTPSDFPLAKISGAVLDQLVDDGVPIADIYPLGPTQHGLLFFHLYDPKSEAYFQKYRCFLSGNLKTEWFKQAWETVIARHPALRSSFLWKDVESPLQIVHEHVELPWIEEDWRDRTPEEKQSGLIELARADGERNLDLSRAPVMRMTLIRLGDEVYHFSWSYHHVLLDGWCIPLLTREGVAVYASLAQDQPFTPPPVRPYRDYIAWLQTQDMAAAEAFWRRTLAGFTRPTQLPMDMAPSAQPDELGEYRAHDSWLPAEVLDGLTRMGPAHQLTLNTLFQGCWALLLSHYSGDRDVVFGVVSSGRPPELPGIESIIGLFITTLPIRARIWPGSSLVAWLQALQEQQAEARQYEYCPLVEVQAWSELPGDQPLFESIQIFENYPTDDPNEIPNANRTHPDSEVAETAQRETAQRETAQRETAQRAAAEVNDETPEPSAPEPKPDHSVGISQSSVSERPSYPLVVLVAPGTNLYLGLGFDSDRFEPTTAGRMLKQLGGLLTSLATQPDRRLEEVSLVTPMERHQLLVDSTATDVSGPWHQTFPELFRAQVRRAPGAVAAGCEGRELTYGELDERSERWARHLAARGAGRDVVVTLLADRGLDFLIAMLGVFKAGAAYLPLDPIHPAPRLARVTGQSAAPLALVARHYRQRFDEALDKLPQEKQPKVIEIEELDETPAPEVFGEVLKTAIAGPSNLSYVIFTSGSTGVPKGAMVEHRGMLNHLFAKVDELTLQANDVVVQNASQCFDISVWQFLAALLVGGRVEILPDRVAHDPVELLAAVEGGVTILETVPSLMLFLLDEIARQGASLPALRWLVPTGEALPPELARRWLTTCPHIPLLNAYGPTECSDDVSHHAVRRPPAARVMRMPIGRALANTRLHVINGSFHPTPLEIPGELLVGGVGVGRGYLGDGGRTAAVFVPDPISGERGERLYRTGDLARFLADGNLEFIGRIDHQVKIRGFRIELGEIESVLLEHPGVAQAVAMVRDDPSGAESLVAYVVTPKEAPTARQLRAFLLDALPEYMVPSYFVFLDGLPLTANGKIDRQMLPSPEADGDASEHGHVEPKNDVERKLVKIWEEILDRREISTRDSFFELGGHSLLVIRLTTRIRDAFGVRLPLAAVFGAGTIEKIAEVLISSEPATVQHPALVRIRAAEGSAREPFFCVHPVGGNVLCYADLAQALGSWQPFFGLQTPETIGLDQLNSIEKLADCYIDAIREVQADGPFRLGGWSMGGLVAFEMARRLEAQGQQVATLAVIDAAPRAGGPNLDDADLLSMFAADLGTLVGQPLSLQPLSMQTPSLQTLALPAEDLRGIPSEELFQRVFDAARSADIMPHEMNFSDAEKLFAIFKNNIQAQRRFKPQPYDGSIVLIRGNASLPDGDDPTLGWQALAKGRVTVQKVPGTHYSMIKKPNVSHLAQVLSASLKGRL